MLCSRWSLFWSTLDLALKFKNQVFINDIFLFFPPWPNNGRRVHVYQCGGKTPSCFGINWALPTGSLHLVDLFAAGLTAIHVPSTKIFSVDPSFVGQGISYYPGNAWKSPGSFGMNFGRHWHVCFYHHPFIMIHVSADCIFVINFFSENLDRCLVTIPLKEYLLRALV